MLLFDLSLAARFSFRFSLRFYSSFPALDDASISPSRAAPVCFCLVPTGLICMGGNCALSAVGLKIFALRLSKGGRHRVSELGDILIRIHWVYQKWHWADQTEHISNSRPKFARQTS